MNDHVRAPLKAMIVGSFIGAYVGTLIRSLSNSGLIFWPFTSWVSPLPFMVSFVSAAMVSAVIVVAFARKKDVQPFITVEDFWGGFFIGFLAGYVGENLLDFVIPEGIKPKR